MEYKIELYELDNLMERHENECDIQEFSFDAIDDSSVSPKEGDIFIFQSNYEEVRVKMEITEFGYKFLYFNDTDISKEELHKKSQIEIYDYFMDNFNFIPSYRPFDGCYFGNCAETLEFESTEGFVESFLPGIIMSETKLRLLNYTDSFKKTIMECDEHAYDEVFSINLDDVFDIDLDSYKENIILNIYTKDGLVTSESSSEYCFTQFSKLKGLIKQQIFLRKN